MNGNKDRKVRINIKQTSLAVMLFLIIVLLMVVLQIFLVQQRPEVALCIEYLKNNPDYFPNIENVLSVTLDEKASSRVSFLKRKTRRFLCF
jgi:hypothetical protein